MGIDIEINGVGNVDDVVLRSARGPHRYKQVKWSTTTADLVTTEYLTARPTRGRSLLEKFFESWRLLGSGSSSPPILELVTNRALDRGDALLALCDGRTDLLMPAAQAVTPKGAAGQMVRAWASHLDVAVDDLLAMLERLRFRTGLTVSGEKEHAQALMAAAGLRSDEQALELGIGAVARWVREGRRSLVPDDVQAEVDALSLGNGPARAVLLVQAIDRDPHPDDATEVIDVVDLYQGESPFDRRKMRDPSGWRQFSEQLNVAVARLRAAGHRDVLVRGAMRLGTFFVVGSRLAQVTGASVAYCSTAPCGPPTPRTPQSHPWSPDECRSARETTSRSRTA